MEKFRYRSTIFDGNSENSLKSQLKPLDIVKLKNGIIDGRIYNVSAFFCPFYMGDEEVVSHFADVDHQASDEEGWRCQFYPVRPGRVRFLEYRLW